MTKYTLENIVKGKLNLPFRLFIYGAPGVGKSTFASEAPDPIFLGVEGGTSRLDIERLPEPKTWEEVLEAINFIISGTQDYKTLVIDPINWIEPMVEDYVCRHNKQDNKKMQNIEEFGYGKGHALVRTEWRMFLKLLERVLGTGRNIIIIAHSQIKAFKNPVGPDFDKYRPFMNDKSADLFMQWSEDVLFAEDETETYEKKKRVRGISTGKKIMHTTASAGWVAKNRCSIPDILPLSWSSYAEAVGLGVPANAEDVLVEINELLPFIEDKAQLNKIEIAVNSAKDDAKTLSRYLNKIRVIANRKEEEDAE